MLKESILPKDIVVLNMYVYNNRTSKYMRQKLIELQTEIDKFMIIFEDFNIPFPIIGRFNRHKISNDTFDLNSTVNQFDDIFIEYSIQ